MKIRKILISLIVLLICVFVNNYSQGAWTWVTEGGFTRPGAGSNNNNYTCSNSNHKNCKVYKFYSKNNDGKLILTRHIQEKNGFKISYTGSSSGTSDNGFPFTEDIGVYCFIHDTEDTTDDEDILRTLRYKIEIIDDTVATTRYTTAVNSKIQSNGKFISVEGASQIAYVLTTTESFYNSNGKVNKKQNHGTPQQWVIWRYENTFFKKLQDLGILKLASALTTEKGADYYDNAAKKWTSGKSTNRKYEWISKEKNMTATKTLDAESLSYATYVKNYAEPTLQIGNYTETISGNNKICGPFKAKYSEGYNSDKTIKFGGLDLSMCYINDTTAYGNGTTWYFCDANGNKLTDGPKNDNTEFYICVSKNTTLTKLKLGFKRIKCSATIYDVMNADGGQEHGYLITAKREYDTSDKAEVTIPLATLELTKQDANDSSRKLSGVKFTLKSNNDGQYVGIDASGNATYNSTAQTLTTNTSGKITIKNLKYGSYTLKEIENSNVGYEHNKDSTVDITVSSVKISKTVTNSKKGKIKVIKKDANNTNKVIKGVKFDLYGSTSTGVIDKSKVLGSYVTADDGTLTTGYLAQGTYYLVETEAPYPYEVSSSSEPVKIDLTYDNIKNDAAIYQKTITNTQAYVNLSGYVWEDMIDPAKVSVKDGVYTENSGDKVVANVKVLLKDVSGNIVKNYYGKECSAITDSSGEYKFEGIKIENLDKYHVEFEYNGMSYEAVATDMDVDNGNKAADVGRDEFDANFEKIENNKVYKGTSEKDVSYKFENYISTLQYGTTGDNVLYGYDGARYPITGQDSDINNLNELFRMSATTSEISSIKNNGIQMTADNIIKNGIETITGINFGIVEREQPDLALTQDIDKVEVSFNGSSHTFKYGERGEAKLVEVKEKFEGEYSKQTYTRALFPADISHESNSLNLAVVYKIGLENQSTNLTSRVNEFKFYFDVGYEMGEEQINATRTYADNNNNITNITVENGVATITLRDTMAIESQDKEYVYVIVNVKKDTMDKLLEKNTENSTILNVYGEITSYTTFEGDKCRAGIDTDSNPNSVDIANISTFEDDTDRAPGFNLVLQEERSVSGSVFKDKAIFTEEGQTEEGINSGAERKGNGIYDEDENGIKDVTVRLTDTEGNTVKVYDLENDIWKDAEVITDANGDYFIDGIIPGVYQIRYTWGNQEYLVENYKSTTVDKTMYEAKESNEYWYRTGFESEDYSDALDDWGIRTTIDTNSSTMKNDTIEKLKQGENQMTSSTPKFKISYEYSEINDGETAYRDTEYDVKTENYKDEWTVTIKKDSYANKLKNVDFGIIERPKQDLKLTKRVKHLTLTLTNGTLLTDAETIRNEDGTYKLQDNVKDTTYVPESEATNGMLKIETTNEISQSAQIQVNYEFAIENISELDYATENYYKYGIAPTSESDKAANIVKLKPISIIDYMDNADVSLQTDKWKLLENTDITTLVTNGYLSESIKDNVKKVSKIMEIDNIMDENSYLFPKGIVGNNNKVLEMVVSKLIAPNEDFEIGNQAEIIQTKKTAGAIMTSTHGNYDPIDETPEENDNGQAEDITILPPTGENRDYIMPVTIGICSMLILGIGIIIIKKNVIK